MNASGEVDLYIKGQVATVTFNRPEARNAMTWSMYDRFAEICTALNANDQVRVTVLRGAGDKAFVAGTDIQQFQSFTSGDDGVNYEEIIDARINLLETLRMPTIAVVQGYAIGGGLAMATACDFRLATPNARFGVPIARTVGNCLSVANVSRLMAAFGLPRSKRMLLLAELIEAEEALQCGYVHSIVEAEQLDQALSSMCDRLVEHAPLTMQASKETMRRLTVDQLPDGEDLIRLCYGSSDFKIGMQAFVDKQTPQWCGA